MGKKEIINQLTQENELLKKKVRLLRTEIDSIDFSDIQNIKDQLNHDVKVLKSELSFVEEINSDVEFGIYNPDVSFEHVNYLEEWNEQKQRVKELSKDESIMIIYKPMKLGGNEKKGIRFQKSLLKLGIKNLNNTANILFKSTSQANFESQISRITKEFESINKLFDTINAAISNELRKALKQSFDCVLKMKLEKENDREKAREERERIKEEEKLQAEVDRQLDKINDESEKHKRRMNEIIKANNDLTSAQNEEIEKLKQMIQDLQDSETTLQERLQKTGAGYVYIISNIGSFGEGVYKIGVTRRLEPEVRIRELSSASVPFKFDKHALIWSEKAFILEKTLHKAFTNSRVNKVNKRKEFFNTSLEEIKAEVSKITDTTINWIESPEAIEYRLTLEEE